MTEAPDRETRFYLRAMRRIYVHMIWLGAAGTVVCLWRGGLRVALGFLVGAAVSAFNFRWLHRMVDAIGLEPRRKPSRALSVILPLRYVLFGAGGYVIVKYFRVDVMAALVGLFVAVAAVMVEIVFELIYARA